MSLDERTQEPLGPTPDPQQFFRELLEEVVTSRGFDTSEATAVYLVSLLADNAQSATSLRKTEQPFAVRLARALEAEGGQRFEKLRTLGDDVLFVSGFFSEHLVTRGVPLDYVTSVGRVAYGRAASMLRHHALGPAIFEELADNFRMFVSLLQHVADSLFAASTRSESDVLDLYERWQRTRSKVLADALLRLGILPPVLSLNATPGSRHSN